MTRTRKLKKEGNKIGGLLEERQSFVQHQAHTTKPTSRAYMPGGVTKGDVLLRSLETFWVEPCNALSHLGTINTTPARDWVVSYPTVEIRRGGVPLIVSNGNILIRVGAHFVQNRIQKPKPSPERTPQHSK